MRWDKFLGNERANPTKGEKEVREDKSIMVGKVILDKSGR